MPHPLTPVLALLALIPPALPGQRPAPPRRPEAALKQAVNHLVRLASRARAARAVDLGRTLLQRVLDRYDPDHFTARRMLGYKRAGRGWVVDAGARPWRQGKVVPSRLTRLRREGDEATRQATAALRLAGLADLAAGRESRGKRRLATVLRLRPGDATVAKALGLAVVGGLALPLAAAPAARRSVALRELATELLATTPAPPPGGKPPVFLTRSKLSFRAVECDRFVLFTRGSTALATQLGQRGAAALALLARLHPVTEKGKKRKVVYVHLWNAAERDRVLAPLRHLVDSETRRVPPALGITDLNWVDGPVVLLTHPDAAGLEQALVMDLVDQVVRPDSTTLVDDLWALLVADLVCGRMDASFTPCSAYRDNLRTLWPGSVYSWFRDARKLAKAGGGTPFSRLLPLARDDLERPHLLKLWSFGAYLLRRDRQAMSRVLADFSPPEGDRPGLEARLQKEFGEPYAALEKQWRRWVLGPVAAPEGLVALADDTTPPPVREALAELNRIRALLQLPGVEAVPELCRGCRRHLEYLVRHKPGPEGLHTEKTRLEGHTPAGTLVAGASFISTRVDDGKALVHQALHTLTGRAALLCRRTTGIGLAVRDGVGVLCHGCAASPPGKELHHPFFFPPSRGFTVPLRYQAEAGRCRPRTGCDPTGAGYPLTLHLPWHLRFRKRRIEARLTQGGREVAGQVWHAAAPLYEDRALPDLICFLPDKPLAPETVYRLRVTLALAEDTVAQREYTLVFVTGR